MDAVCVCVYPALTVPRAGVVVVVRGRVRRGRVLHGGGHERGGRALRELDGECRRAAPRVGAAPWVREGSRAPAQVFCAGGASAPSLVPAGFYSIGGPPDGSARTGTQVCPSGNYCVSGSRIGCPFGTYGEVAGLTTAACSGLCGAGFVCPVGSRSGSSLQCPQGYYCAGGRVSACPAGTYNAYPQAVSAVNCTACPANTYSAVANATALAACAPCARYENSTAGALACWPGVVSIVASNPPPVVPALSARDVLTITFSKPTNAPRVSDDAEIHALLVFSSSIGVALTGSWNSAGTVLAITVGSTSTIDGKVIVNPAATRVGVLRVSLNASATLRDAALVGPRAVYAPLPVAGDWGTSQVPAFLDASGSFAPSYAADTGRNAGLGVGDTLVLRFNNPCKQLPVATMADVDALLAFSSPLGLNYTGAWLATGIFAQAQLTITVTAAVPGVNASAVAVGALVVTVRAAAGMTSLDGSTRASNSSTVIGLGTWGDVPSAAVDMRSYRSLRVTVAPAASAYGWLAASYSLQWATSAGFGSLLGSVVAPATSGSPACVYTIRGLAVGVPVYVRVAAVVLIKFNVEGIATGTGPYFTVALPVTPSLPALARVSMQGGSAMSTTGLQTVVLSGTGLGLAESPTIVSARYTNGNFSLVAAGCQVSIDGLEVQCATVVGVGAAYEWHLFVDGGNATVQSVAAVTLSYAAPVLSSFEGPGAVGASTAGGQLVTLRGSGFGPVGGAYITRVTYSPTDAEALVFTATGCAVSVAHVTIECTTSRIAGARVSWVVTIAQLSSSSPSTSVAQPVVTHVARRDGGALSSLATRGGNALVITGANLAPSDSYASWMVAATMVAAAGAAAPIALVGCNITTDFAVMVCTTAAGRGAGYNVVVSVLKQASAPSGDAVSYAPPNITSLSSSASRATAAGGLVVTTACVNCGVGALSVYVCPVGGAHSLADLAASCVALSPVTVVSDGAPLVSVAPPLAPPLAGIASIWFVVVSAGQVSNAWPLHVAPPSLSPGVVGTKYAALAAQAAPGGVGLGAAAAGCFAAMTAVAGRDQLSLLSATGGELGVAAAVAAASALVLPRDASTAVPCTICSLGPGALACFANTTSPEVRNGQLVYTIGVFSVSVEMALDDTPAPRLLSVAVDGRAGVIALPGPGGAGADAGDTLVLRFSDAVYTGVPVGSRSAVDALLSMSAPLAADYSGAWVSPMELRVTLRAGLADPTRRAVAVGVFTVAVRASAKLTSASRTSPSCTSAGVLEAGSWGDAVAAVSVQVRSSTQLLVDASAPDLSEYPASAAVTYSVVRYSLRWSTSAAFSGALALNVSRLTGFPVTLSGLATNVPVYVVVSATVQVIAGSEVMLLAGPAVAPAGGAAAVPRAPVVTAAVLAGGGGAMTTRGGESVTILGSDLGIFTGDVTAVYASPAAGLAFSAATCDVGTPAGAVLLCVTSEGAGAGFTWRVTVGNATSNASPIPMNYELPVITQFSGVGADGAETSGGQFVRIGGAQFGPVGRRYIDRIMYAPAGFSREVFDALNCSVTTAHVEITCSTGPGAGARLSWLVVIANQSSTVPSTRYAPPAVASVSRADGGSVSALPTNGSAAVRIAGANFGAKSSMIVAPEGGAWLVRGGVAGARLVGCAVSAPHVQITCSVPDGIGEGFSVLVSVLGQESGVALTTVLSYAPPTLLSVSASPPGGSTSGALELPTGGGATLTITGDNLGSSKELVRVLLCPTPDARGPGCAVLSGAQMPVPHRVLRVASPAIEAPSLLGAATLFVAVAVGPADASARVTSAIAIPVAAPTFFVAQTTADFVGDLSDDYGALQADQRACVDAAGSSAGSALMVLSLAGVNLGGSRALASFNVSAGGSNCVLCAVAHSRAMCLTSLVAAPLTLSMWTGALWTNEVSVLLSSLVRHPVVNLVTLLGNGTGVASAGPLLVPTMGATLLVRGMDFKSSGMLRLVQVCPWCLHTHVDISACVCVCVCVSVCVRVCVRARVW